MLVGVRVGGAAAKPAKLPGTKSLGTSGLCAWMTVGEGGGESALRRFCPAGDCTDCMLPGVGEHRQAEALLPSLSDGLSSSRGGACVYFMLSSSAGWAWGCFIGGLHWKGEVLACWVRPGLSAPLQACMHVLAQPGPALSRLAHDEASSNTAIFSQLAPGKRSNLKAQQCSIFPLYQLLSSSDSQSGIKVWLLRLHGLPKCFCSMTCNKGRKKHWDRDLMLRPHAGRRGHEEQASGATATSNVIKHSIHCMSCVVRGCFEKLYTQKADIFLFPPQAFHQQLAKKWLPTLPMLNTGLCA